MTAPEANGATGPVDSSHSNEAAPGGEVGGDSPRLACGSSTDDLLAQVADGGADPQPDHQADCVHCRAALAEFAQLWAPITASAAAPVPVPAGFTQTVMRGVRRLAEDTWYSLELTDGGSIRIAARVVATLARDAARSVPGVRVALGRSTAAKLARLVEKATLGHRHPNAAVGVLGRTAVIDLALATSYGEPVHDVALRVQQAVMTTLRADTGLKSIQVNVVVDDVLEDD